MSNATATVAVPQVPATLEPALAAACPWWKDAKPLHRAAILAEYAQIGVPEEEYVEMCATSGMDAYGSIAENLSGLPWWAGATPEEQAAVVDDYAKCRSGATPVTLEEYCTDAGEWPTAAEYLADAGW